MTVRKVDPRDRARLLATAAKESGAWLNVQPISSLGLRMDDDTVRVAVSLRLGAPLCRPHNCHHCGLEVDNLATHGLNCRWSEGRHYRHAALNDIVWNHLASFARMGNVLMASLWSLGRVGGCWSGA